MFTTTNAKHVLVAGNVGRTASASTDPNSANYLADGEVVIVSSAGTVLSKTAALAEDTVRIAQRSGDQIFYSPMITGKNVSSYKGSAYSSDLEQISYLGWNGTSGAIDEITSNDYLVRIIRQDTQATYLNKEMLKFGAYRSLASTSEEAIAKGLTESLIANFSREPEQEIKFERVCSGTQATDGTATSITVTNGSTAATLNAGATTVAVGDYLVIGGGATDAVYEITALVGTAVTLDVPYQGTSAAGVSIDYITAANVTAGDMGIKMTGVAVLLLLLDLKKLMKEMVLGNDLKNLNGLLQKLLMVKLKELELLHQNSKRIVAMVDLSLHFTFHLLIDLILVSKELLILK
jgi:hypothetical protein